MTEFAPCGEPKSWMSVGLWTNPRISDVYELGYDVKREIIGGRLVASGAADLERTFTLMFTTYDPSLSHIGASIDFTGGIPGPNQGPVSTSDVQCNDGGLGFLQMNPGMPVFWNIRHGPLS